MLLFLKDFQAAIKDGVAVKLPSVRYSQHAHTIETMFANAADKNGRLFLELSNATSCRAMLVSDASTAMAIIEVVSFNCTSVPPFTFYYLRARDAFNYIG